jgi:hypothetical protein
MINIAKASADLGIRINILYTSNAEDYFTYQKNFIDNVLCLPADGRSYVIRTIQKTVWKKDDERLFTEDRFHYNVQPLLSFQRYLKKNKIPNSRSMLDNRRDLKRGLSIIDSMYN